MISLEQGFQFVLFVSYIALVGIQSFWMCSWTCSIPWSSIDASISLETLIWCHIIPWLNLVFLLLFPSHAIPSLKPSQSVLLHYGEKKKKKVFSIEMGGSHQAPADFSSWRLFHDYKTSNSGSSSLGKRHWWPGFSCFFPCISLLLEGLWKTLTVLLNPLVVIPGLWTLFWDNKA